MMNIEPDTKAEVGEGDILIQKMIQEENYAIKEEQEVNEKISQQDYGEEQGENEEAENLGEEIEGEYKVEEEKADSETLPEDAENIELNGEEEDAQGKDAEEVDQKESKIEEEIEEQVKEEEDHFEEEGKGEEKEVIQTENVAVEEVIEEEAFVEEPPPDPAAPFDFSDSKEALKPPFELRQDQLAELEQLWELFQNYTPVYSDINGYITEKELVYMLKSLLLMTYTVEQLQELIAYCVRPPDPHGRITYEQFVKMVTIRQRDNPVEEELRSALQVLDPEKTGLLDREHFRDVLNHHGNKMSGRLVDNLIKEVDITNDGILGVEDVLGTMCIDLNKDDLVLLMNSINPPKEDSKLSNEKITLEMRNEQN